MPQTRLKNGEEFLEELNAENIEDEGSDGDELNKEEDTADEGGHVCAREVDEEVVCDTLLFQRERQGEEKAGVGKRHNDQRESNNQVSEVVFGISLIF